MSISLVVVGNQFWTIVRFMIHQLNTTTRPTDALHRQHQAIFRNTSSAAGASLELFQLPFSWRRDPNRKLGSKSFWRILIRSWALGLVPILNFTAWAAAGLLSSEVTKGASSDTLIQPGNCGIAYDADPDNPYGSKLFNDSFIAYPYVRACYGSKSKSSQCNYFIQQQIRWHTNANATCPFKGGFCYFSDTAALELDTKYIDSHKDIGINAPPEDRIYYRKVTTCAVLDPEAVRNRTTESQNEASIYPTYQYHLGPSVYGGDEFTFQYDSYLRHSDTEYILGAVDYNAGGADENRSWWPLAQLGQTDADLTLIWVSPNSITATEPIDDPFFGFHNTSRYGYESDNYVNIMACTDQYQVCNPMLRLAEENLACTPLTSPFLLKDEISKIGLNPAQNATARLLLAAHSGKGISSSVFGRDSGALVANEHVELGYQNHLPNDQWMIEVQNWFAISLSKLQFAVVEYATGPPFPSDHVGVRLPSTAEARKICTSIKVPNSGEFMSFSTLGLGIIFIVGTTIVIVSIILEPSVAYAHKHCWAAKKYNYRRLQWILDGKLQLQRMAYESAGVGTWEKKDVITPVTADEAEIFCLPPRDINTTPPEFPEKTGTSKRRYVDCGVEFHEQDALMAGVSRHPRNLK